MRTPTVIALALLVAGCSSSDPVEAPAPDDVVHYSMTTTIPAGTETEHCRFVTAPPEGMLINDDEVVYSEGSHHVLLFETNFDAIPDKRLDGSPIEYLDEATGVFDCAAGVQFDFGTVRIIAGSQNVNGDSLISFPPDVAMRVEPGAVLLLNAHYINTTPNDLEPQVDVKLHTIDESQMAVEGGVLFFYNIFIKLPQQDSATATMRCNIPEDITITSAQSHMHARGVDFEALTIDSEGKRTAFYENTDWEEVPVKRFDGGMAVAAGTTIEHTCGYQNNSDEELYMGQRSTDEMCVLFGSYYPAKPHIGLCSGKEEAPEETFFFGAEWPGQGATTCADSLGCFNGATSAGGGMFGILRAVTDCVVASDPAIAPEYSEAVGCSLSSFLTGGNPLDECGSAYSACLAK